MKICYALFLLALPMLAQAQPGPTEQGPVENLSATRGRVVLNGLWKFQPAIGVAEKEPVDNWGLMPVPGMWLSDGFSPGRPPRIRVRGTGELWKVFGGGDRAQDLRRAWYERSIFVPPEWRGRRVLLDFRRVSTDARVWVNGKPCGEVAWPYGRVDITEAALPGQTSIVRVLVIAEPDEGTEINWMGYLTDTQTRRKARLESAGLIGEVFLVSEPRGAAVRDVFVQTSTRKGSIALDIELAGIRQPGAVSLTARMLAPDGTEERVFTATQSVAAAAVQKIRAEWPWPDPRLWDVGRPELYDLLLTVEGPGIRDEYRQRFGFREFWIEGRSFFLNGKEIRLRPQLMNESFVVEEIDGVLRGALDFGFNILQIWPNDHSRRGTVYGHRELIAERADEIGMPLIGPVIGMQKYILGEKSEIIWNQPGVKERYRRTMEAEIRRYRNNPSILIWGTTGNFFNQPADQDPRLIGQRVGLPRQEKHDAGDEGLAMIRAADPTRPVFTHAGNFMGDIYTANNYLLMAPLQERIEWLSDHVRFGQMPYIAIEFGTPLHTTMMRGRKPFSGAQQSEPWLTEFCAIYLGSDAYRNETPTYRGMIASKFIGNMKWENTHLDPAIEHNPVFHELQRLFVRETWRHWRTAGITGGMIPWALDAQGFAGRPPENFPLPQTPGRRGAWFETINARRAGYLKPEAGWEALGMAQALRENNGPTLAWIAGSPLYDQTHLYREGETIFKQIALLNDSRVEQPWEATWSLVVGNRVIEEKSATGTLAVAQTHREPVRFRVPAPKGTRAIDAKIVLKAKIGDREHQDEFPIRIHPKPPALKTKEVLIWDPSGKTKVWLEALGVRTADWDGSAANKPLVIGRAAFSAGGPTPPGDLAAFVRNGGRVLMMAQEPDWLRRNVGMRVSRHVTRRVFPVQADHPLVEGLTNDDLRDWRGTGTLVEPYPMYKRDAYPYSVWHWGNRHSVASAPVEKPHFSGWRPLLECEFDLAYTPLMELDYGRGRITYCALDLEDQAPADPVADLLSRRILDRVAFGAMAPRVGPVAYIGDASGSALLDELGVHYKSANNLQGAGVVVLGPGASVQQADLNAFLERGGRALILAAPSASENHFGMKVVMRERFHGASTVPPASESALAGIGISDLHVRAHRTHPIFATEKPDDWSAVLAVKRVGRGVAVYTQLDPPALNAEKNQYFRLTRWRQLRTLSQILANLGASFKADERIFRPLPTRISLAGDWKVKITSPLPVVHWDNPHKDPGISPQAQAAVRPDFDDSQWETFSLPAWYPPFSEVSGEAVWRRVVNIPPEWAGKVLVVNPGRIKSYDTTFWNGRPIGSTDANQKDAWNYPRSYRIAGEFVKPGPNVLAIRQFAPDRDGGIHGNEEEMFIRAMIAQDNTPPLYALDYREDFEDGDEPYRYYRW